MPFLLGAALLAGGLKPPDARAEPIPSPRLDSVFPMGGKAGSDTEVTLSGDANAGEWLLAHGR